MDVYFTPKFKETEVGLVPVDWDVVPLGRICDVHNQMYDPTDNDIVPYVGLEHITPGTPQLTSWGMSDEVRSSKTYFYPGQVLYGKLRPYLDKAVLATFEGVCSTDIIVVDALKNVSIPSFLVNLLHTERFLTFATSTMTGVNHPRTRWSSLRNFQVVLPPLPEQRRIAAVLNAIQEAIAAQEDVIAEARAFKRSLMQRLFTYGPGPVPAETKETEIGEIPSHWEVVELGELVLDLQNGLYKPSDYYGSGYPILRIDAYEPGDTIDRQLLKRLRLSVDELETYALETGNIIVNRVNGNIELVGKAALIGELTEPTVFESNMIRVRVNPEVMLDRFLLQFLCTPQARDQIRQKARLVHQASINQQDLKSFPVPLPNYDEQRKVASLLADADAKIAAEKDRKAALQDLFKSTLHQLMTGQVRLLDDEGVPL